MNQLYAMRVFCSLVEAKGFSAAAERLATTHSTISRQVQQLEAGLGARLVNRNTRRLSLTRAGEQYYQACLDILKRVDAAALAVADEQARPSGLLRVSAPLTIGTLEIGGWLPPFQARYPEVHIDLSCDDQFVDLVAGRFDVALRISAPLADSSLVARPLTVSEQIMVAAPAYVMRHGLVRSVEELPDHCLLAYVVGGSAAAWTLQGQQGQSTAIDPAGALRVDTITALYGAALAGAGIAMLTRATVQADLLAGRLVQVLPQWSGGQRRYYAVYPHAQHLPAKVRVFVDFMREYYAQAAQPGGPGRTAA